MSAGDNGKSFTLVTRACDNTGDTAITDCAEPTKGTNIESPFVVGVNTVTFSIDSVSPVVAVTVPNQLKVNLVTSIEGQAADASPVPNVEVAISSGSSPRVYWKAAQSTWVTAYSSNAANAGQTWDYPVPGPLVWKDGETYTVHAWAKDSLDNRAQSSSITFVYDASWSSATMTWPVPNSYRLSVSSLVGGASDWPFTGTPALAELAINEDGSFKWFDPNAEHGLADKFNSWGTTIFFTLADNPDDGEWTYQAGAVPWENGKKYNVTVRITDDSGNETQQRWVGDPGQGTDFFSFIYDIGAPGSVIASPANGSRINGTYDLSGSSSDAKAGVAYVEFVLEDQNSASYRYWTGSNWQAAMPNPLPKSTPTAGGGWTVTGVPFQVSAGAPEDKDGHSIVFYTKAWDRAYPNGNSQTDFAASSITFTYDMTPPLGEVTAPQHMSWQRNLTRIDGTASSDATWVDLWLIMVNPGNILDEKAWWDGTAWINGVATATGTNVVGGAWRYDVPMSTFTDTQRYKVKVQPKDIANNVGAVTSANVFYYDISFPTAAINIPASDGLTFNSLPQVSGTAQDLDPGRVGAVKFYIQREDGRYWDGTYNGGSGVDWGGPLIKIDAEPTDLAWDETSEDWRYNIPYPSSTFSNTADINWYTLFVEGYDKANGMGTLKSRTFTWDSRAPDVAIKRPTQGTLYTSLKIASGTFADPDAISAISQVGVVIWDKTANLFWNTAAWGPSVSSITANIDVGQSSWSIQYTDNKLPPSWPSGHTYLIRVFAKDTPGNEGDPSWLGGFADSIEFVYDDQPPTSNVSDPQTVDFKKAGFNLLAGNSADDLSVGSVGVQIVEYSVGLLPGTTRYWGGSGWTGDANSWSAVTGQAPWTYTIAASNWRDGYKYVVRSSATDTALNAQTVPSGTNNFIYDLDIPTATIVVPPSGSVNSVPEVSGGYGDIYSGSDLNWVKISIKRDQDGFYWEGTATGWVDTAGVEYWLDVTETEVDVSTETGRQADWVYADIPPWADQQNYTIRAKARDKAGNEQDPPQTTPFTYDLSAPQSAVTTPLNSLAYNLEDDAVQVVQGWAKAGANPITEVTVKIHNDTDNQTFNGGGSWSAGDNDTWLAATLTAMRGDGSTYWEYTNLPSDVTTDWPAKTFTIYSRAKTATRTEPPGSVRFKAKDGANLWSYIDTPKSGYVGTGPAAITGRAWDRTVTDITISVKRVSDGQYWNKAAPGWQSGGEVWNSIGTGANGTPDSKSWSWDPGAITWSSGKYILRPRAVKGYNELPHAGNVIFVDVTAPQAKVKVPSDGSTFSKPTMPYITGTATDDVSGVASVKIWIKKVVGPDTFFWTGNSGQAGTWETGMSSHAVNATWLTDHWEFDTAQVDFTDSQVYHFRAFGTDAAGNYETSVTADPGLSATADATGPTSLIGTPADGLAFKTLTTITGTASDTLSIVAMTQVSIKDVDTGMYWNGATAFDVPLKANSWNDYTAGLPTNWTYYKANIAWFPDHTYEILARAVDSLNNVGAENGPRTIVYDNTPPTTDVEIPSAGQTRLNALPLVRGTADDNKKATNVEINLVEKLGISPFNAWNCAAGGWVIRDDQAAQESYWCEIAGSSVTLHESSITWTLKGLETSFTPDFEYRLRTRARDQATNVDVVLSTRTFKYDRQPPESFVTVPADASATNDQNVDTLAGFVPGDVTTDLKYQVYYVAGASTKIWNHDDTWVTLSGSLDDPANWFLVNSVGAGAWSHTDADFRGKWVDNVYYLRTRAVDSATNEESTYATALVKSTFTFDRTPPNDPARMAIVDPFQSVVVSLPVVRGTASDLLAGIDAARFRLRDKEAAGNPYWTTNGQWEVKSDDDPVVWLSPDAYAPGVPVTTTTWSWNKPGGLTWLSNNLYELNVKAGDRAGNWSTVYSTRSFRLDADPPMVLIKGPSQNSLKLNFDYQANTLATLSGTAQDVLSLMQRVEVEIRDLTYPSTYWHTSYWAPNSSWSVTADGGGAPLVNWNYDIPIDSMTSGRRYTIRARAVDEPGNVTASGNYSVRSDLLMDFTNPISTIPLPAPGQIITEGFVTIEGTATDPAGPGGAGAGINRVEYRLKRVVPSPERFWTGSDWSATSVEPSDYPDGTLGTPPAWAHTFSGIIPWV